MIIENQSHLVTKVLILFLLSSLLLACESKNIRNNLDQLVGIWGWESPETSLGAVKTYTVINSDESSSLYFMAKDSDCYEYVEFYLEPKGGDNYLELVIGGVLASEYSRKEVETHARYYLEEDSLVYMIMDEEFDNVQETLEYSRSEINVQDIEPICQFYYQVAEYGAGGSDEYSISIKYRMYILMFVLALMYIVPITLIIRSGKATDNEKLVWVLLVFFLFSFMGYFGFLFHMYVKGRRQRGV